MLAIPDTWPIDMEPLKSTLSMPYTLTPGRATGAFLAEIVAKRIVGSRFKASGNVVAPAQDFDPLTGESDPELVEVPNTGTLGNFTKVGDAVIGLIRLDGCDVDFPHQIVGVSHDSLAVGDRVEAVWADEPVEKSILSLAGFKPSPKAPVGQVKPLDDTATPVDVVPYKMELHYEHAFGPYYGRLFDEIKTNRKIMGTRTPDGLGAFLPPREYCDVTHKRSGTWVECGPEGTVRACSIIYLEFMGQTRPPPYIYAEIILDGASTRLIHTIDGVDMTRVKELVKPGVRVRAVWSDQRTGSLKDISHFELLEQ